MQRYCSSVSFVLASVLMACGDSHHSPSSDASADPVLPSESDEADATSSGYTPLGRDGGYTPTFGGEFPVDPVDAGAMPTDADASEAGAADTGASDAAPSDAALSDAATDAALIDAAADAGDGSADHSPDGGCQVQSTATDVDLLLMIDNSGSMAEEQARLGDKLSRLVSALTSGDKEAGKTAPRTDEYAGRRFTPPRSLHIGIVTSTLGAPPGVTATASNACLPDNGGAAGNGLLQYSGAIAATDQINANTQIVAKAAVPACAPVALNPHYLAFGGASGEVPASNAVAVQNALFQFTCVATVGLSGCGIEQPLESIWKALAPHTQADFVGPDTLGQGDRGNAGFQRADSVLAVVAVTDEDDCSVTPQGTIMFERSTPNGVPAVNVRCQLLKDDPAYANTIFPMARYVGGLLGLRPGHPERVLFAGVVGLPQSSVNYAAFDALLSDARMKVSLTPDSSAPDLVSACGSDTPVGPAPAAGKAYPGRRYVELAKGLTAAGGNAVLRSICDDDYGPVVDSVVERIATQLTSCGTPASAHP